ncbi:MAG: adenylate/guanylate cyclase domain-containing protein [Proteobacteria bacterium]|nr:MAG: adenylate/guanylate cyclase domain-containing protein [Pseudomonadota bacterium]
MISDLESTFPEIHLRSCRKRTAFVMLLLFFHWAFVLIEGIEAYNFLGMLFLGGGTLIIYPWQPIRSNLFSKLLFWVVIPFALGLSLAATSHLHPDEAQGFLPISLNLLCLALVPLAFFRIISPTSLFLGLIFGFYLLRDDLIFSYHYMSILYVSNLLISCTGWRISTWLQDLHRSRVKNSSLFKNGKNSQPILHQIKNRNATVSRIGLILQFDLRGFSALVRIIDENMYEDFMHAYYALVSSAVGQNSGTIHRTSGDCHVVCFGVFQNTDLSPQRLMNNAIGTFNQIVQSLASLSKELGLNVSLNLGGAIDYGELRVSVLGHQDFQQDVDLIGSSLIRCARLEAHTKLIMTRRFTPRSLLIFSPAIMRFTRDVENMDVISIRELPVRDFPHIKWLAFKEFEIQN